MKKFTLLFPLVFFVAIVHSQDKSALDIVTDSFGKSTNSESILTYDANSIQNESLSLTMISRGFFTLGTNSGKHMSPLDDNSPLTFGHPYAMTSYPIFSIDGDWHTFDSFFEELYFSPTPVDDGLAITATKDNLVAVHFTISIIESAFTISLKISNLDTMDHSFALGIVYDPSLGKGSDASMFIDDQQILRDTTINTPITNFSLWERPQESKGIGLDFSFGSNSPGIIAANWVNIYETPSPTLNDKAVRDLYDIALKMHWPEITLESETATEISFQISLLEPDFSSEAFARWDLPSFLSIENNKMFPRSLNTFMEISSIQNADIAGCELHLEYPSSLWPSQDVYNFAIPAVYPHYQNIKLNSSLVYEDKVVDVTAKILKDGTVIDKFIRKVFLPATPVSDTGLRVLLDSLQANQFPKVSFTFKVENEEEGYLISSLKKENIFLYENESRISEFNFGKDTTGGIESADIIFVLDVTGSMSNEINDVKNNIIEFTDSLELRGVDYQLGMVTFLDEIENVYPFTDDAQIFKQRIEEQYAHGGGDGPENSLDALFKATEFNFRENSKRIVVWITDQSYHEQDWATDKSKEQVIDELLTHGILVHAIGTESYKSAYYDPITAPTGGNYYNINGNFRDILLDISRLKSLTGYLISYQSINDNIQQNKVNLEIRYAGLGGDTTFTYDPHVLSKSSGYLLCYPNPFNPEITFSLNYPEFQRGDLTVYNVLGQVVKSFKLTQNKSKITWNARNDLQQFISSGFYYVSVNLLEKSGKKYQENAKILYLK